MIKGCANGVLTNNYFAASGAAVALTCQSLASVSGNTFFGPIIGITPFTYPNNRYFHWQPKTTEVYVRHNMYEPGRGHVVVYNWEHTKTVSVDLSDVGLKPGDRFEIRDAQNYHAAPVVTDTYWPFRRVTIPMTGLTVAAPAGAVAVPPRHTAPEFGAFVVRKTDDADKSPK